MKKTLLKTMLLLCALVGVSSVAWAEDELVYTLTPSKGSNNSYASNCDIDIDGITWNLTGNSTMIPWRIGGNSLSNVDRALYSKTAISDDISKIEVTHGAANNITVNSWTVIVSKNNDFSNPVSTLTPTFYASSTSTISRPDGADWSNCYFKFVYNVTVSGSSNKFIEFTEAKFYKETFSYDITPQSNDESWGTVSLSGNTITATPATGYRVSTTTPYTVTPEGSATVSQSGNTFTVTPSANTTVTINFEAIPTHTVTFSVNGTTSTATIAEGATIEFPSNPADVNGMTFVGWYTSTYDNASVAPDFVTSATMENSDVTYYAVFANVEGSIIWQRMAASSSIGAGTYALLTNENHAFNGVISSGHGQSTNEAFTFVNGEATSAPEGICEIELVAVSGGYKMYNSNFGYLYAKNNSSGNLAWHNTENSYWLYESDNWKYKSNGAYLRSYNNTFRTYGSNSNSVVAFAKKVNRQTYSNYCTTVPEPAITLSTSSIEASAAGADGTVNVTYTAIDLSDTPAVEWYTDATATATTDAPNWIETEIDSDNNLLYVIGANDGAARTAYLKIFAIDVNGDDFVYSDLITVTQAAATVTVTVGAKGYATFVNAKALDFTGKSIKAYTINSTDGSALTLTQKDQVAANEPVLLYSETASDSQDIPVIASATADSNNKLVRGTGAAITWSETNPVYVLNTTNTPAFYRANNSPVATNKAYLDLTGVNPSRSFFTLSLDGEVQGISDVNRETMTNRYFDMQGRRVAAPQKGLYIVNGKKVVVK